MQTTQKSIRTAIGRYVRLKELGFPPAAIRVLLEARTGVPFPVADGITLVVAPDLHASGMEARAARRTPRRSFAEDSREEIDMHPKNEIRK